MSQIKKKWIGDKQVDGNKILLDNAQPLKAKTFLGVEVDLLSLNAANEIEILKAPRALTEGEESNSLQTKNQLQAAILVVQNALDIAEQAILDEASARTSADANLQSQINAIASGFSFKYGVHAITDDAGLAAASEGATLSALLPFSDDEAPEMVIGDFSAGDKIISKSGATSKVFEVYDDAGTLKLTFIGVSQPVQGDGYLVKYDLPDSPSTQETNAIYYFNGDEMVKLGDFDWSLASGINVGSFPTDFDTGFTNDAPILPTDSINEALAKIMRKFYLLGSGDLAQIQSDIADLQAEQVVQNGRLDTIDTDQITQNGRLDSLEADVATVSGDLAAEVARAIAAEGVIAGNVTTLSGRVTTLESEMDAAQAELVAQDGRLDTIEAEQIVQNGAISAIEAEQTTQNSRLSDLEASDVLQDSSISGLQSEQTTQNNRLTAVEGVNSTQTSDIANIVIAQGVQDGRLDDIEAKDIVQDADILDLQNAVAAIEAGSQVHSKYIHTIISQNLIDGYIDIPFLILSGSMVAGVDRVMIHEGAGEDYTISTVSGVSRMTFLNDLVAPSGSALEVGDKVYTKFAYDPSVQL